MILSGQYLQLCPAIHIQNLVFRTYQLLQFFKGYTRLGGNYHSPLAYGFTQSLFEQ